MTRHFTKPWILTALDDGRRVVIADYDTEDQAIAAVRLLDRSDFGWTGMSYEPNPNANPVNADFDRIYNASNQSGRELRSLTLGNKDALSAARLAFDLGRSSALAEIEAAFAAGQAAEARSTVTRMLAAIPSAGARH